MRRKSRVNAALAIALIALALAMTPLTRVIAADGEFTIVYLNDVHGHIEPFKRFRAKEEVGALAKAAVYIEELRKEKTNILLLAAGDMIHGTTEVNFFGGLPVIEVMNHMGFDAMAIGNHEFDFGQDRLFELAQAAKFPFLSANVARADDTLLFDDCTVFDVGGVKVGVFGLTTVDTPITTHPKNVIGLKFLDAAAIAGKMVDAFSGQVDVIICLSHLGIDADVALATAVPGIDVIVGGHSHTALAQPRAIGKTLIVQAGEWAEYVGVLDVSAAGGKIASFHGELVKMTAEMPGPAPDDPIAVMTASYKAAMAGKMAVVVGSTSAPLDGESSHVHTRSTNLTNLITDAIREFSGADVVMINGGGIRASINPGDITVRDIYNVLPFADKVVVIELTGDKIIAALEHGLRKYPEGNTGFCQVSGMTVRFDSEKPAGSRVVDVLVAGKPITADELYTVATNDFMAAGGDGYVWFTQSTPVFKAGDMFNEVVIDYIRTLGAVEAPTEMRVQPIR